MQLARRLVTAGLACGEAAAGIASAWTETRAFQGVTVHDLYCRRARYLSSHASPAEPGLLAEQGKVPDQRVSINQRLTK
jgi:hypothetical protein